MKFFKNKRAVHNLLLFCLTFIYVFVLGLFENIQNMRYVYSVFATFIFFASILSVKDTVKKLLYIPIIVMIMTWVAQFLNMQLLSHITGILTLFFFLYIIVYLLIQVATAKQVGALEFLESINVYLLLGIAASILFAQVYAGSQNAFNTSSNAMDEPAEFIYFSFVTMTTMGYGDIVPVEPTARTLTIFFSVAGQLYLAMIVALLIGKYLSQTTIIPKEDFEKEGNKNSTKSK